jgi:hypothetical protein
VGADVRLDALERLAGRGRLLRVDDTAALPRLVRGEVVARRTPPRLGSSGVRSSAPLPFETPGEPWPPLDGYAPTRARPGARVHLESAAGDPILAAHMAGAGRVVALPGGLDAWAAAWVAWPGWARFGGALLAWTARAADDARLHVRVEDRAAGLAVIADALDGAGTWSAAPAAVARVVLPSGETRELALAATAPGRFETVVPAPLPGTYTVSVRVGDRTVVRHGVRHAAAELAHAPAGPGWVAALEREGRATRWPAALVPPPAAVSAGPALALAAVAAYLLVLRGERARRYGQSASTFAAITPSAGIVGSSVRKLGGTGTSPSRRRAT